MLYLWEFSVYVNISIFSYYHAGQVSSCKSQQPVNVTTGETNVLLDMFQILNNF